MMAALGLRRLALAVLGLLVISQVTLGQRRRNARAAALAEVYGEYTEPGFASSYLATAAHVAALEAAAVGPQWRQIGPDSASGDPSENNAGRIK